MNNQESFRFSGLAIDHDHQSKLVSKFDLNSVKPNDTLFKFGDRQSQPVFLKDKPFQQFPLHK